MKVYEVMPAWWGRKPHVTPAHAPGQQGTESAQVSTVGKQDRTY